MVLNFQPMVLFSSKCFVKLYLARLKAKRKRRPWPPELTLLERRPLPPELTVLPGPIPWTLFLKVCLHMNYCDRDCVNDCNFSIDKRNCNYNK